MHAILAEAVQSSLFTEKKRIVHGLVQVADRNVYEIPYNPAVKFPKLDISL